MNNQANNPNRKHGSVGIPASPVAIPRGIEVLVKKAAVDPEFRQLLLEQRGGAAAAIELQLEPAEIAMLDAIPPEQLSQLISQTVVPMEQRRIFLGRAAAAMLVAVGATALLLPMCTPAKSRGIQTDRPRRDSTSPKPEPSSTDAPPPGTPGIRPDRP